jgi:hypothetical protein
VLAARVCVCVCVCVCVARHLARFQASAAVHEVLALLGCYSAYVSGGLPTFRNNLSVPSSKGKQSTKNYQRTLYSNPEERKSHDVVYKLPR